MKKCFKCNQEKPLSDFYKHLKMADGYLNKCKSCTKLDVYNRRHGCDREKVLDYERTRAKTDKRRELSRKTVKDWKMNYPDRRKAQNKVHYAIEKGILIPWPVCAVPECNCVPEAHHPDYSRPLDVVWLCSAHHKQTHALIKDAL